MKMLGEMDFFSDHLAMLLIICRFLETHITHAVCLNEKSVCGAHVLKTVSFTVQLNQNIFKAARPHFCDRMQELPQINPRVPLPLDIYTPKYSL